MTESFNLLRRVQSLDISPELSGYSRVTIYAGQNEKGEDKIYTAGDDSGTTLEITNEWGTPEMAKAILKKIQGWRYQPYKAGGSSIDPSSEIGDAVTISDIYGGIFAKKTTYGKYIRTDLEAPSKEEVEHEFQVQSPTDRQYARFTASVRADLTLKSDQIKARVEKTVGDETSDFWWDLQAYGWSVGSKSKTIFSVKEGGAEVEGEIRATSGSIGGFTIKNGYLCTNGQDWGGSNSAGIYIGSEGIQCGSASNGVQLTSDGNLYAENGYFRGNVSAGKIDYGGNDGYFSGSGLVSHSVYGSQIGYSTISTAYTNRGINTSLDYADTFNDACSGSYVAEFYASYLYTARLYLDGKRYKPITIQDLNGSYYSVLANY